MIKLGEYYVDRFLTVSALDPKTNSLKAVLKNVSEGSIEISAESKEVKDAQGNLIQKIYTGKTGTFTFKNALLHAGAQALISGGSLKEGTADSKLPVTMTKEVPVGTANVVLTGAKEGTITVAGISGSAAIVKTYTLDTTAAADKASFATEGSKLTLPTGDQAGVTSYLITYDADLENVVGFTNNAKEFPKTIKLVARAVIYEACDAVEGKVGIIEIKSAKLSPETTMDFQSDSTLDFKGDIQADYCSANKELYSIYFLEDEE